MQLSTSTFSPDATLAAVLSPETAAGPSGGIAVSNTPGDASGPRQTEAFAAVFSAAVAEESPANALLTPAAAAPASTPPAIGTPLVLRAPIRAPLFAPEESIATVDDSASDESTDVAFGANERSASVDDETPALVKPSAAHDSREPAVGSIADPVMIEAAGAALLAMLPLPASLASAPEADAQLADDFSALQDGEGESEETDAEPTAEGAPHTATPVALTSSDAQDIFVGPAPTPGITSVSRRNVARAATQERARVSMESPTAGERSPIADFATDPVAPGRDAVRASGERGFSTMQPRESLRAARIGSNEGVMLTTAAQMPRPAQVSNPTTVTGLGTSSAPLAPITPPAPARSAAAPSTPTALTTASEVPGAAPGAMPDAVPVAQSFSFPRSVVPATSQSLPLPEAPPASPLTNVAATPTSVAGAENVARVSVDAAASASDATVVPSARAGARENRVARSVFEPAKTAARGGKKSEARGGRDFSSEKSFLTSDAPSLASSRAGLGIDVAKPAPTMVAAPSFASASSPVGAFGQEAHQDWADVSRLDVSATEGSAATTGAQDEAVSVEQVASAERAVEVVLRAVDRVETREQHAVNLCFSVGGDDLDVRVELHANEVRAIFRTESPELRAALSNEWNSVNATAPRAVTPVFTSSDANAFAQSQGEAATQQRDAHARRARDERAIAGAGRARRAGGTTSDFSPASAAAPVNAVRSLSGTSVHLHTLA